MIGEASVEGRPSFMWGRIDFQPLASAQRPALAVGGLL